MAEPSVPGPAATGGVKLTDILRDQFGWIVKVFGSAAVVTAFLLFAGFLSDFGAFRLAGLPRLNMTITALIEQGADTLIDSFALLGGGVRAWVLVAFLTFVVLFWGWCDSPRLRVFTRSVPLYRLARVLLLVLAVLVAGGLVERIQRSMSGAHHSPQATEDALREAYSDHDFPDPYQRALALERQTYELRLFPLPNWGARLDSLGFVNDGSKPPGIVIRQLAEGRDAARHVFGWLALSVLVVLVSLPLLAKWGRFVNQDEPSAGVSASPAFPEVPSPGAPAPRMVAARRWSRALLRGLGRVAGLLGRQADQPLAMLLAPLTLAFGVLSMALLPLAHGLLARESLGAETVMVYLDPGAADIRKTEELKPPADAASATARSAQKLETSVQDLPESAAAGPAARMDCDGDLRSKLREPIQTYRDSQRDLMQHRTTDQRYPDQLASYGEAVEGLATAVVRANCAEAVTLMLEARPPLGLRATQPELAELFQRAYHRVQAQYRVRVGSILGFPRDNQGLVLADNVVPVALERGGRVVVSELRRDTIVKAEVIPDLNQRALRAVKRELVVEPDSTERAQNLLTVPSGASLATTIELLRGDKLHANRAGVALTAIGAMTSMASHELPTAARDAIDLLASVVDRKSDVPFLVDRGDEQRGTAVSSLHLARHPYAAHALVAAIQRDRSPDRCAASMAGGSMQPLECLSTVPTAAGYAFQDLLTELQNFRSDPPRQLIEDRDALVAAMVDTVIRPNVRDAVRGAACSALSLGGKFEARQADGERFLQHLMKQAVGSQPFSTPSCITATSVLGLERKSLRSWLRAVARTPSDAEPAWWHFERRRSALVALADLGLEGEVDLMFELFLRDGSNDALGRLVRNVLNMVAGEPMAARLRECALDPAREATQRALCVSGFRNLDQNFDGDDGAAPAVYTALVEGRMSGLEKPACDALQGFLGRKSLWMQRKLREDRRAMDRCRESLPTPSSGSESSVTPEMMRELFERLRRASSQSANKAPQAAGK